jgi:hypothetical protein
METGDDYSFAKNQSFFAFAETETIAKDLRSIELV